MVSDALNLWATYRFALSYPDERHLERFRALFSGVPRALEDLRAHYIELFEAGIPQPKCPLLESAYAVNRPAGEIVLENKMFYQNFGLKLDSRAAPDHLLTQLEFLAWLDHCIESGNPEAESLIRARREFLDRRVATWIPAAVRLIRRQSSGCYVELLESLQEAVEKQPVCPASTAAPKNPVQAADKRR
jgi:DMSO reductase family type II enzyme chaperone